jgi:hypothetical protein
MRHGVIRWEKMRWVEQSIDKVSRKLIRPIKEQTCQKSYSLHVLWVFEQYIGCLGSHNTLCSWYNLFQLRSRTFHVKIHPFSIHGVGQLKLHRPNGATNTIWYILFDKGDRHTLSHVRYSSRIARKSTKVSANRTYLSIHVYLPVLIRMRTYDWLWH